MAGSLRSIGQAGKFVGFERCRTNGVGRIAARVIEQLVVREPLPKRKIIDQTRRCRCIGSAHEAAA